MTKEAKIRDVAMELMHTAAICNKPQRFTYKGTCMSPTLVKGDHVLVTSVPPQDISFGDIIVFRKDQHWVAHRVLRHDQLAGATLRIMTGADGIVGQHRVCDVDSVLGKIVEIDRNGKVIKLDGERQRLGRLITSLAILESKVFQLAASIEQRYARRVGGKLVLNTRIGKLISAPRMLLLRLVFR